MQRAILAVATVGVAAVLQSLTTSAAPARDASRVPDWCLHGNRVRFEAADGTKLVGARYGRGTVGIVLAHQSDGNLCQWQPYARRLAALGYLAFPFDFRDYGESQFRQAGIQRQPGDVAAAVKAVRRLGATKVFLVGASMGGTAVLVAAVNLRTPIAGVVSVSGPAMYGPVDALAVVPKLSVPVLYLAGADDLDFATDARKLYAATGEQDKALDILPSGAHGVMLLGTSAAARSQLETFISSR